MHAKLARRNNRFLVTVKLGNRRVLAHLPNPGRLRELLYPGSDLLLDPRMGKERKTSYTVLGVSHENESILLDTGLSNRLAEEAIDKGHIAPLQGWKVARREFPWKDSRFDFLLQRSGSKCLLEVKACTLVREGRALFPDSPTVRGQRQVTTLARAVKHGYRACIFFTVHRQRAESFQPNSDTDPKFCDALGSAMRGGVEACAYEFHWKGRELGASRQIPVTTSF